MIDLRSMRLGPGDVRHERPRVAVGSLTIAGQEYTVTPAELEPRLDLQAASGGLYLKLAFSAHVEGPCFRCLEPAQLDLNVRIEFRPPIERIVFALPDKILDRADCPGLCPRCGVRLEPDVPHDCGEPELDTRWAKLSDLL